MISKHDRRSITKKIDELILLINIDEISQIKSIHAHLTKIYFRGIKNYNYKTKTIQC